MRPLQLSEEDKLEITRPEEAMWRAETRFDLNFQRTRFAQDFFEFGRSGRVYHYNPPSVDPDRPQQARSHAHFTDVRR